MHSRMRHRVAEFLKVLNRAKPETAEKERKTATCVLPAKQSSDPVQRPHLRPQLIVLTLVHYPLPDLSRPVDSVGEPARHAVGKSTSTSRTPLAALSPSILLRPALV